MINPNPKVPQGSVLGPILFVVYINDIIDNLKCNAYEYADDMKIYTKVTCESDRQMLQDDINTVVDWTNTWLLKLNINKCKVLTVGTSDSQMHQQQVTRDGKTSCLSNVKVEKDLGILVDSNLSFDMHIQDVVKKANRILGVIKRNFKFLDCTTFIMLYKSMVRSHLE